MFITKLNSNIRLSMSMLVRSLGRIDIDKAVVGFALQSNDHQQEQSPAGDDNHQDGELNVVIHRLVVVVATR